MLLGSNSVRRALALIAIVALGMLVLSPPLPAIKRSPVAKYVAPKLLADALRIAKRLGPAGPSTEVHLNLALKARDPRSGPDEKLASASVATVRAAGLRATWSKGSLLIAVDGPAPAAASLLQVDIENYRLGDGTIFYAANGEPTIPASLAAVVSSVDGLDSFRKDRSFAVRPGGLTPIDVIAFYNLKPLIDSGLDGSGQTIVLPEIDNVPNLNDVNAFAKEFGLPPFDGLVDIKKDPSWGNPLNPQGEAALDLEIIHEIAPKAKLVVYESGPSFTFVDRAFDQMVSDHLGSIISESLGACELGTTSGHRTLNSTIQDRATALGMTHFVASGDGGAYTCGESQAAAVSFPSSLPSVTAVGGTAVFQAADGSYGREMAWGSAIDQSGAGGGPSRFFDVPDYQKAVDSTGHRQVPDVAGAADPATGFHIVFGGRDGQVGGTSAATPLWAATTALINQDLKRKGMREVGFANPALYWMGANANAFTIRPFHDVTDGNNLLYKAGPGWDMATGWGSFDAVGLDQAWIKYIKANGA